LGQASRPLKIEHKKTLTFIVRVVEKIGLPPRRINLSPDGYKSRKAPNGASLFVEKIGLEPTTS
jgi:hypothetical protein